ncbi:MAG: ATP-binding protein [Aquabacterium sp.]
MTTPAQTPPIERAADVVRSLVLRHFFGASVIVALGGAVLFSFVPPHLTLADRLMIVAGFIVLAALSAWGLRSRQDTHMRAMTAVVLWSLALITLCGWLQQSGTQTPGLVFLGLIVCMVAAVASERAAWWTAAGAMASVAVLGGAEWALNTVPSGTLVQRLVTLLLVVGTGLAAGLAMARVAAAHVAAASERERRFRSLLGIAVSAYWETDPQMRLRQVLRRMGDGQFAPIELPAIRPTEVAAMDFFDTPRLAEVRDCMQRRVPFRDLPAFWQRTRGQRRVLISGDPHLDALGKFVGYWGVVRDVTNEHAAQQALAQSQALLAQVVAVSPDVITLTDLATGRYEMVNQRFTEISGYTPEQVIGRTAAELGMWVEPEGRQRLVDAVATTGGVRDLPLLYRVASGSTVSMQVSARRLERDGRAWLVVSARDMTRADRERLEREAMLAHASVGIVFSRQGRIELANPHAERLYHAPPGGLIGRQMVELLADPGQADAIRGQQRALFLRGDILAADLDARRLDGGAFTALVRASPVDPAMPLSGTVWIVQDITERRRTQAALATARDQAEAANRAKSAFLANTSHEIRTPLHGLLGLAQLARRPDLDTERRAQYLDQIVDSAQNLSAIISDILDLSKIEAGRLEIEHVVFDLAELLQSLHRAYAPLAAAQDLACELRLAPGLPQQARGDPLRLRQVLANFLNNALKFTASGGITIEARHVPPDRVRITVADTGDGVAEAAQARLFRPFSQADESTTRRFGGTGLGLSICRELATLMGGEVGLHSAPGQGSRFHVELPLPADNEDAEASGFGALDGERLSGARVLLVEDNAVNMMIAAAMLEQWGVSATQAEDGDAAIRAVDAAASAGALFDAVLMDVQMPGISGYDATRALRRRYSASTLPVIALTAAALASERETAAQAGMTDFVTKPIDARRLRRALLKALRQ